MHDHHLAVAQEPGSVLGAFHHALHALMSMADGGALPLAMLVAGLTAGFTHCVGMCGPFVLTQVASDLGRGDARGAWSRTRMVLRMPYHLGRLTTYSGLGAVAGGAAGLVTDLTGFRWILGAFLGLAALYFAARLAGMLVRIAVPEAGASHGRVTAALSRGVSAMAIRLGPAAGTYGLGVALGFLPCGLVYGALAAAAGSGGIVPGAAALAAFGAGTVPGLVAVGAAGAFFGRRWLPAARLAAIPLLLANFVILGAMAWRTLA